jgi:ABC-2 type transport system permease protein
MPSRTAALARHQLRYLASTSLLTVAYVVVPFVLIGYFRNAYGVYLRGQGYGGATGAELAVPGVATLYCILVLTHDGVFVFSEHLWNTWDRVRAVASPTEIVVAKVATTWVHILVQTVAIFAGSMIVFSFPVDHRVLFLLPVMVATVCMAAAWGCLGYVLSPTNATYDAWCYGGGVMLAAIGGAISPLGLLPKAIQDIAPISPVYWTMKATQSVLLDNDGASSVVKPTLTLFGFALVLVIVAGLFFDPSRRKAGRLR